MSTTKGRLKLIAPILWCALGFVVFAVLGSNTGSAIYQVLGMVCWIAAVIYIVRGIGVAHEARKQRALVERKEN